MLKRAPDILDHAAEARATGHLTGNELQRVVVEGAIAVAEAKAETNPMSVRLCEQMYVIAAVAINLRHFKHDHHWRNPGRILFMIPYLANIGRLGLLSHRSVANRRHRALTHQIERVVMDCQKFIFADALQLGKTNISTIGRHYRHLPLCLHARSRSSVFAKASQGSWESDLQGAISRTFGLTRISGSSHIQTKYGEK